MKEGPILFTADMVRATIEERKTKTRRTRGLEKINQSPDHWERYGLGAPRRLWGNIWFFTDHDGNHQQVKCPYGQVGDRLWVRETHNIGGIKPKEWVIFKADYIRNADTILWRPSIHMPRWASRLTLENQERMEVIQAPAHTADDYNPQWAKVAPKWQGKVILPDDSIWHWDWDFRRVE